MTAIGRMGRSLWPGLLGASCPDNLLDIDIKKLARIQKPGCLARNQKDDTRGASWGFLDVAVDNFFNICSNAARKQTSLLPGSTPLPTGSCL